MPVGLQGTFKIFTACEHRMGLEILFQAVAARNENKFAEIAVSCPALRKMHIGIPCIEEAATCKPTSDA